MANKYNFYGIGNCHSKQKGLYITFVERHKIPVETLVETLDEIGRKYDLNTKTKILYHVSVYFQEFIDILQQKTGKTFKKKREQPSSYDRWYESASLDGSLAYNGVADDF